MIGAVQPTMVRTGNGTYLAIAQVPRMRPATRGPISM
jgi:hypothetical protein